MPEPVTYCGFLDFFSGDRFVVKVNAIKEQGILKTLPYKRATAEAFFYYIHHKVKSLLFFFSLFEYILLLIDTVTDNTAAMNSLFIFF